MMNCLAARLLALFSPARRGVTVLVILLLTALIPDRDAEHVGDRLQVALPLAGWACAFANGDGGVYALRFAASWLTVHGLKHGLGDTPINRRPSGGLLGFPSGHTAAASFGASYLAQGCLQRNPWVAGASVIAAGFTGASRIEARAHTIWQVFWGALIGWVFERAFRRRSPRALWRRLKDRIARRHGR